MRRSATATVATASVIAAVAGYFVLLIAARALGPAGYAAFAALWALLYLIVGVLFGAQQELTRALHAHPSPTGRGTSVYGFALAIGVVFALAVAALSALHLGTASALVGTLSISTVATLAVGSVLASGAAASLGALAAHDKWYAYGLVVAGDGVVRLIAFGVAWAIAPTVMGFTVASVSGFFVWLAVIVGNSRYRGMLTARVDLGWKVLSSNAGKAMLAAAATAMLVVAFPALLTALSPHADPGVLGTTILVVTLTRAPLLVPLFSFQSMLVVRFRRMSDAPLRALRLPLIVVVALGLVVAVGAGAVVPPLLPLIFGDAFAMAALPAGLLAASAASIGLLMVTGAATLAHGRHNAYVGGWLAGTALAVALLLTPWGLTTVAALSLGVGPLLGVTIHLAAIRRVRVDAGTPSVAQASSGPADVDDH